MKINKKLYIEFLQNELEWEREDHKVTMEALAAQEAHNNRVFEASLKKVHEAIDRNREIKDLKSEKQLLLEENGELKDKIEELVAIKDQFRRNIKWLKDLNKEMAKRGELK